MRPPRHLLEGGGYHLLEGGGYHLLEHIDPTSKQRVRPRLQAQPYRVRVQRPPDVIIVGAQ
jgi:hypothetical protein